MRKPALLLLSTMLSACAAGPSYVRPDTDLPKEFAAATAAPFNTEAVPSRFWTVFNDEVLSGLIEDALSANHDLRIAAARFNEARALRREAAFDFGPVITANGSALRTRFSDVETSNIAGGEGAVDVYDAGFDATWELDIFGRVRRGYEARRAELESTVASLEDALVSVTSEVARNYFELRGLQSRYDVAKRNSEVQGSSLELTQARREAGSGTDLDVARAQSQLSTTLATLPDLEAAITRTKYRIAVLLGRSPGDLDARLAAKPLAVVPAFTPVGDPADWLRRRPDVRVAERDLAAATARIGIAVGDLFPRVSLVGSFGWTALDFDRLGEADAESYRVGPSISWAIFDLGHVQARIAAANARAEGSLARYEQTVLRALEDTEGALTTYSKALEREASLQEAAQASGVAAGLASVRYEEGVSDFLLVLDAERTQLEAEDRLAQSRADSATALVAVYKALGAGWQDVDSPYIPVKR
ncbi:MAG TPA: efflux transporter outer membrane subunit [Steroidobacteraceae bacterium]|nr:efflux transporter outer membrane subunit [Steroidobacteraceae bacterium]